MRDATVTCCFSSCTLLVAVHMRTKPQFRLLVSLLKNVYFNQLSVLTVPSIDDQYWRLLNIIPRCLDWHQTLCWRVKKFLLDVKLAHCFPGELASPFSFYWLDFFCDDWWLAWNTLAARFLCFLFFAPGRITWLQRWHGENCLSVQ